MSALQGSPPAMVAVRARAGKGRDGALAGGPVALDRILLSRPAAPSMARMGHASSGRPSGSVRVEPAAPGVGQEVHLRRRKVAHHALLRARGRQEEDPPLSPPHLP